MAERVVITLYDGTMEDPVLFTGSILLPRQPSDELPILDVVEKMSKQQIEHNMIVVDEEGEYCGNVIKSRDGVLYLSKTSKELRNPISDHATSFAAFNGDWGHVADWCEHYYSLDGTGGYHLPGGVIVTDDGEALTHAFLRYHKRTKKVSTRPEGNSQVQIMVDAPLERNESNNSVQTDSSLPPTVASITPQLPFDKNKEDNHDEEEVLMEQPNDKHTQEHNEKCSGEEEVMVQDYDGEEDDTVEYKLDSTIRHCQEERAFTERLFPGMMKAWDYERGEQKDRESCNEEEFEDENEEDEDGDNGRGESQGENREEVRSSRKTRKFSSRTIGSFDGDALPEKRRRVATDHFRPTKGGKSYLPLTKSNQEYSDRERLEEKGIIQCWKKKRQGKFALWKCFEDGKKMFPLVDLQPDLIYPFVEGLPNYITREGIALVEKGCIPKMGVHLSIDSASALQLPSCEDPKTGRKTNNKGTKGTNNFVKNDGSEPKKMPTANQQKELAQMKSTNAGDFVNLEGPAAASKVKRSHSDSVTTTSFAQNCLCCSCKVDAFRRDHGLAGEISFAKACIFSRRLHRDMEDIARKHAGSTGAGYFLQKLEECRKSSDPCDTSIVYSYVNQDLNTSAGHIFGKIAKTNRGQMTFDIFCIHVPDTLRLKNIGGRLYSMLEEELKVLAKRSACDGVMMRTEAGASDFMEGSKAFWTKCGFKRGSLGVGDRLSSTTMEKFLDVV